LVDIRSPDEFSGKILAQAHLPEEQAQRAGHITGAINVPWSRAANEDGTFKSDEDLTAIYAHAGLPRRIPTNHRLLPHRCAFLAHLVCIAGAASSTRT
jgi:thiosulfate/3-mercaptopyruvate sulfurtransferase